MLNGMIEMSGGSASMLGRDVSKQMDEIRTFMGVCPQHDVRLEGHLDRECADLPVELRF